MPHPPHGAADEPIDVADAFDIPVFIRHSSPLIPFPPPSATHVEAASARWPAGRGVPRDGAYLVTTTWRDLLDAAATVGRDPTPWFASVPALAWSECVARWSPLQAYLRRDRNRREMPGYSNHRVEPNAVYRLGAERTAKTAFGYRAGMTMAEWVCRGLMGLGPTMHAEDAHPDNAGGGWSAKASLPDLVGTHPQAPATWLVEAKGARRIRHKALAKGARQLTGADLIWGPHARVLCGASLEPRLSVTVDFEIHLDSAPPTIGGDETSPENDDDALVSLSRSRMLTYFALRALPASARSVRPVGPTVADPTRQRRVGLIEPLERDPTTRTERQLARDAGAYARLRPTAQRLDMLTGLIPGTGVIVGMSRRLFEACRNLASEELRLAEAGLLTFLPETTPDQISEDQLDKFVRQRRADFAEREFSARPMLRASAREGFERGRASSWQDLLDEQPRIETEQPRDLLESATADTYLAINTDTVPER